MWNGLIVIMYALEDVDPGDGGFVCVPGSHKADDRPEYDIEVDTIAATMPAGSVVFWHGSLWHAGGANRTEERRYTIANYYCSGFFRPQENQQLGIPIGTAKRFPRRLQELCGYSVYKGLYGHVDNEDPIVMLDRESDRKMTWARSRED